MVYILCEKKTTSKHLFEAPKKLLGGTFVLKMHFEYINLWCRFKASLVIAFSFRLQFSGGDCIPGAF